MLLRLDSIKIPSLLRGSVLIDTQYRPRFWAIVWCSMYLTHVSQTTRDRKMKHLDTLYQCADVATGNGSLDEALRWLDLQKIAAILDSFFQHLNNKTRTAANERAWRTGTQFIIGIATRISSSSNSIQKSIIEKDLNRVFLQHTSLHLHKSKKSSSLRALPEEVIMGLLQLIDPDSKSNPFNRLKTRWTVFTIVICLLQTGMRVGELLLQRADAVKREYDKRTNEYVMWLRVQTIDDSISDSRRAKPGIKNSQSIRNIPIDSFTAKTIQTYTENYRGRVNHNFLISSAKGKAISQRQINRIFKKISDSLPPDILQILADKNGKYSIVPHDLRHTCVTDVFIKLAAENVPIDLINQKLRRYFGWSYESNMPRLYANAAMNENLNVKLSTQIERVYQKIRKQEGIL